MIRPACPMYRVTLAAHQVRVQRWGSIHWIPELNVIDTCHYQRSTSSYKKTPSSIIIVKPPPNLVTLEHLGLMSYQANLPHSGQAAKAGSKSKPIPIPNLQPIDFNFDTYGLTSNYRSPSSGSESTFANSYPSSPIFSPNQACFNTPFVGHQSTC
jgi:hypothetical protein